MPIGQMNGQINGETHKVISTRLVILIKILYTCKGRKTFLQYATDFPRNNHKNNNN